MAEVKDKVTLFEGGRYLRYRVEGEIVSVEGHTALRAERIFKGVGSRIRTPSNREIAVLKPTIEGIVSSIKRGAQIISPKDIGSIVVSMPIYPGQRVIESGLGSGALTAALLTLTGPNGRVISIERDERWINIARRNLEAWGLTERWSLHRGDMYHDEISPNELGLDTGVDAIILDLPEPWRAFDNVERLLEPGGMLAIYVPSFNQLHHSIEALEKRDCYCLISARSIEEREIEWFTREGECILRPEMRGEKHTGFILVASKLKEGQEGGP